MTLVETLVQDAWFAQCQPALQQLLLSQGHEQRLGDGESLFRRGDAEADLCCVLEGVLRVGGVREDGRAALLARVEPVQWIGEISLIDQRPRTHDAEADGGALVWRVPARLLRPALALQPALWQDIAQLACAKLRLLFEVLEDIALLPLRQRLARRLLLQARAYGSHAPHTRLRLAQEHLALMLGVSRQSANKALGELEQLGLLRRHYGEIELLDLPALESLSLS
jgi:CRP/FNR family transcriptional regulator, cyclic AMP receptor protein